jgi:hypothetical protein
MHAVMGKILIGNLRGDKLATGWALSREIKSSKKCVAGLGSRASERRRSVGLSMGPA